MASPPHILHLITRWLRGGAEAKTLAELEGLRGRYRFTLVHGAAWEPQAAARVDALGVRRLALPELRHYSPVSSLRAVGAFRRVLDAERPDVLHVHSTEAAAVGRAAVRGGGLPVVYTLHGLPFGPGRAAPLRAFVRAVERRYAPRTTRFLANADAIRDAYLAAGIGRREQYVTIPSGIDLDAAAKAPAAADLPGEPPRVLFAGRLEPGKGAQETLVAMAALRSQGTRADVLVAGEGPLRAELERLAPWAHFLGYRHDLPAVLKACDVLALPSRNEGTPRVITEAMACGVPVVATRVGGIPEQVDHGASGLLVPVGDRAALREALRSLLADPAMRSRMGSAGEARAKQFSRDAMLATTDAVYRGLLATDA